jgi:hypothetical protein
MPNKPREQVEKESDELTADILAFVREKNPDIALQAIALCDALGTHLAHGIFNSIPAEDREAVHGIDAFSDAMTKVRIGIEKHIKLFSMSALTRLVGLLNDERKQEEKVQ